MPSFIPEVNQASEFLEISNDFTDPKEVVREAVSNSFDYNAKRIDISINIDKSTGVDELIISISDDGDGMVEEKLKSFFGLGFSDGQVKDERGNKVSGKIGEKGHGTKIYFNSRRVQVISVKDGIHIDAVMENPKAELRRGNVPMVNYTVTPSDAPKGTKVVISGYNNNNQKGFGHEELRDYLYWFTKFGSFEKELGIDKYNNVVVYLAGLGWWGDAVGEPLDFGHRFPPVDTDIRTLKAKDKVSPLDYYVAKWVFSNEQVIGLPSMKIDFVFYLEGDKAKRAYNKMIHQKYQWWRPGEYNVEQRYGLWLCKDHIPVERKNAWVSERSEWTKYHAFVNCQEFTLTANRGDLNNTPSEVMGSVQKTIEEIFRTRIVPSQDFQKYRDELEYLQEQERIDRTTQYEETDFERRKKAALAKRTCTFDGITFYEPRQEGGLFGLFLQIMTLKPHLFDFKIIDYDTYIGYDLLVTKDEALDLNRAAMKFVELKHELRRDFNHSFKKIAAVVCWDTKLSNEDEVTDTTGAVRTMKITPPLADDTDSYTKYMLVSSTESHNIEVFVLKDYFRERLGMEFRPRTT